jgi:flagellar hook-associated protein 1 FlgK
MSDLLSIGRSGIIAYRAALSTVGENVSNANSDGYTQRTVTLTESGVSASTNYQYRSTTVFGGVDISSVQRVYDDYKTTYARTSVSDAGSSDAKLQWLQTTETALNDSASGLGVKLTSVFSSAEALATDVNSQTNRQTVLSALQDAAHQFNETAQSLKNAADGLSTTTLSTVAKLNGQLKALSAVNTGLRQAAPGTSGQAQLMDQRDALLKQISTAVGVNVRLENDGRANVTLAGNGGVTLVDSGKPQTAFLGVLQGSDGRLSLVASGLTTETAVAPQGGSLAGLVDVSTTIASRRADLDSIAQNFSNTINSWNSAGVDANGAAGAPLISGTTAGTIAVATTDLSKIAAASTGGVANGNALALKATRTSTGPEAQWALLVSNHAQTVATASAQASATASQRDGALSDLAGVSAVNLDAEAAKLLQYQQAYTASSKIIQVARETLQDILSLIN